MAESRSVMLTFTLRRSGLITTSALMESHALHRTRHIRHHDRRQVSTPRTKGSVNLRGALQALELEGEPCAHAQARLDKRNRSARNLHHARAARLVNRREDRHGRATHRRMPEDLLDQVGQPRDLQRIDHVVHRATRLLLRGREDPGALQLREAQARLGELAAAAELQESLSTSYIR